MDHYDNEVEIRGILEKCIPSKLPPPVTAVLETIVGVEVQEPNRRRVAALTREFAAEAYKELCTAPRDATCFESQEEFMRALTRGVIGRAQERHQSVMAEKALSKPGGNERGR